MLIITDLQGNSEPISDYTSLEINEEVNGDFSLSCIFPNSTNNQHAYSLITEESIIEYEGHEFRIKKKIGERLRRGVVAPHVFFDLIDHQVYDIQGGTKYPNDIFGYILADTGWTFDVVDSIDPQLLFNFGEDNALSLVRKACKAFDCEVKIEPNKHLKIYKQIGKNEDYQFRYKHNIKAIKENVDTSKLATVIRGYGANGLIVTYTSDNASVFGERHAEPIRDDSISEIPTMTERLKRELVDTPETNIELDAVLFGDVGLGDKVWLIHEPLGIEYQTRVIAKKVNPENPSVDTVTLGNRKQTISDLLTETKIEINENNKETRSKIEQTNERITLEVERVDESISQLELTADEIKLSVEDLDDDLRSELSITATQIRSEVSGQVERLDGLVEDANSSITQTANSIRSEVNSEITRVDGRVTSANSSITQLSNRITAEVNEVNSDIGSLSSQLSIQAGQISSKVEKTDYNGNTIASMINQSASSVSISASAINLNGITNVSDTLQLGSSSTSGGTKMLVFKGGARISSTYSDDLRISAGSVSIPDGNVSIGNSYSTTTFYGNVNFNSANINGLNLTAKFG